MDGYSAWRCALEACLPYSKSTKARRRPSCKSRMVLAQTFDISIQSSLPCPGLEALVGKIQLAMGQLLDGQPDMSGPTRGQNSPLAY
jgi:hypothetical protein